MAVFLSDPSLPQLQLYLSSAFHFLISQISSIFSPFLNVILKGSLKTEPPLPS